MLGLTSSLKLRPGKGLMLGWIQLEARPQKWLDARLTIQSEAQPQKRLDARLDRHAHGCQSGIQEEW